MVDDKARTWRKPPFIASPVVRLLLALGVLGYLGWALATLPFDWERISDGLPRAARIFGGGFPPSFERFELLLTGFKESFQIALLATLLGVALSIPFAVMAARNIAPRRSIWWGEPSSSCRAVSTRSSWRFCSSRRSGLAPWPGS